MDNKKYVWALEYCYCIYESGFEVVNLYQSAVAAYNAMKRFRDDLIHDETWGRLSDTGYFAYPHGPRDRGGKPHWLVRFRKIEVLSE